MCLGMGVKQIKGGVMDSFEKYASSNSPRNCFCLVFKEIKPRGGEAEDDRVYLLKFWEDGI